mmetsp:Transcript_19106/g.40203  ORF Transcript_19106/g.40203 Transcript_19106/m.40203 type:complete len:158 (-) Transcript_19106:16-489(-)
MSPGGSAHGVRRRGGRSWTGRFFPASLSLTRPWTGRPGRWPVNLNPGQGPPAASAGADHRMDSTAQGAPDMLDDFDPHPAPTPLNIAVSISETIQFNDDTIVNIPLKTEPALAFIIITQGLAKPIFLIHGSISTIFEHTIIDSHKSLKSQPIINNNI